MVQQVMFCISRFLKKDIFWIFLLRLAPNNYSCTIQPDTAVYSCLVLNLVVLVLFFFFLIGTIRDQGFANNNSEKHTRVMFHCWPNFILLAWAFFLSSPEDLATWYAILKWILECFWTAFVHMFTSSLLE